ncbi:MATE family efflux transporter [Kineothrix sp. MSJ-39]|uniref:MATE family efflux transporter n=1 Tax=Kineothrix sp. MSJ-39 TaxID=2841533 RepID=UPI00209CB95A|nr:MATE family efflux transporter [Kineothrix sp. MSJ-39]
MQKEKKSNSMDMIHGSLWNKILLFALPLAASSILQQLFNSVDTAVVGRFASSQALAAVGSNSSLISLMINLFLGVSLGSNVVIAHYIGQGSEKNIKAAVHTAMLVAVLCGFFVLLLGQVIARPVLLLMGTPEDVIDLAVLYLRIYLLGMPCIMLYDFGASILRSTGDSKRPLYALIAAGIINTILNLILVIGFGLGVSGVAIATVISNMVSAGIVLSILLHEKEPIRVELKQLSIVPKELKKILVIGIPAGLQGMMFSIANVCIQSAINSFGSNAIAGSAAALNFEFFAYFIVNAFAQTTVTFTSQNYGAGEVDRCKKIFRLNMVFSLLFCGMLSAIFVLGRGFFLRLYTTDEAVLVFAAQRLLIATTLELLTSTYEISAGAMRGLGHSLLPAIITCVGSCLLRLVWIATACRMVHDFRVLMIIYPISWIITGTAMLTAYFCIRKKCFKSLGRF